MQELETVVMQKAKDYTIQYLLQGDMAEEPFLNIGLQYFHFAQNEPELFKLMFLEGRLQRTPEQMGFPFMPLIDRMMQDEHLQGLSEESLKRIGRDMWIFTHGLITLLYSMELDNAEDFVRKGLLRMGQTIIEWEHFQRVKDQIPGWPQLGEKPCDIPDME
jgi:hypothetical protein